MGQRVLVRNFRQGPKWIPAMILKKSGPLSYAVESTSTVLHGEDMWIRYTVVMTVHTGVKRSLQKDYL